MAGIPTSLPTQVTGAVTVPRTILRLSPASLHRSLHRSVGGVCLSLLERPRVPLAILCPPAPLPSCCVPLPPYWQSTLPQPSDQGHHPVPTQSLNQDTELYSNTAALYPLYPSTTDNIVSSD